MKEFTIFYNRINYNPYYTNYMKNENKHVGFTFAYGEENAKQIISDLNASGHTVKAVYDNVGRKVNL